MSRIDAAFVAALAEAWHGLTLTPAEAEGIARALAAVEAVAAPAAQALAFEAEPAAHRGVLDELAAQR